MNIVKGTRVRAQIFQSAPMGTFSLAGVVMKTTGRLVEVIGVCRHVRGDHPTNPKVVRIYVEVEGDIPPNVPWGRPHGCTCAGHDQLVEIAPGSIVDVLEQAL